MKGSSHRHSFGNKKGKLILIVFSVLMLAALLCVAKRVEDNRKKAEVRGDYNLRHTYESTVIYEGDEYYVKPGLTSMLLIGVDGDAFRTTSQYRSGMQADFLRVVVIDSVSKTVSQIAIDRDTLTEITILGVTGRKAGTRTEHLSLAYGFGNGREQSCELTVDAVEKLLFGMPIDSYIALNTSGIGTLNDALGGVTVTLEEDFSHIDAEMTAGKTMTLRGAQAETYVRSRMSMQVGTNAARMARQQNYLTKALDVMRMRQSADGDFIVQLFDGMQPYIVTNMSRGLIANQVQAVQKYEILPVYTPEGTYAVSADGFTEFHMDVDSTMGTVLKMFCNKLEQ